MTLPLYFDQHVPGAIYRELVRRTIDILRTQDDDAGRWRDERIFERATDLGRVMVSEDRDYLVIAQRWLTEGRSFAGLVHRTQMNWHIGRVIEDLHVIAECYAPEEMIDRIIYLPL